MALQFMDGFDNYNYGQGGEDFNYIWPSFNGGLASQQNGRYSGYSVGVGYLGGRVRPITLASTLVCGFAFLYSGQSFVAGFVDSSNRSIITIDIDSGGTNTFGLGGSPSILNGNGAYVASSAFSFNRSGWTYFEIAINQGTSGSAVLRINGIEAATLTGINTSVPGASAISAIALAANGYSYNTPVDDLYVLDGTGTINNTFLAPPNGDVRVATFFPTGAGADTQLTPNGASTNWQCVSEQSPDFDTTYVASATAGQEDLYAFTPGLPTTNQVLGVTVKTLARKDDSNARLIASLLSSGATTTDGATNALTSTYSAYFDTYNTDPNTSAAWTVAAVNALQAGVKVIS